MQKTKAIGTCLVLLFLLCANSSFSQCAITAIVTDSLKAPVPFITVALLKVDSSIYKGEITGANGEFCFSKIAAGQYRIKIAGLGYADYYSELINYDSTAPTITLNDIVLKKSGVNLDEVSVNAIKNPIEFKGGNITVNVEDSPLAVGNSVYDLLARLPGVMVEGDNISIQGKSGVKVYINDRVQQLSGAQLTNFLRSMSASVVEKIEVINNPPARYDAAGSAGIINIKTKRIKITGPSGGLNYTFSQGFYNTNNAGFSFNYKGKNVTFFSNTSLYEGLLHNQSNLLNHVTYDGATTTMDQKAHENDAGKFMTIDLGADWYINKKNTVGVKTEIVPGHAVRTYNGNTTMSDNSLGYQQLSYNRPTTNNWLLCNYNLNAEHLFDTLGNSKLKFSADYYGPYNDDYTAYYQNRFTGFSGAETMPDQTFRTTNNLGINILAARLDFEKKFKHDLSIEAGIKQSNTSAQSDYTFENLNIATGQYVTDTVFTNRFKYNEQISAAYVSLDKTYKKFNFRAGLRGENTNIHTESITSSIKYSRQYANLFPTLSVDYNPTQNHSLSFAYNRRIDRPDYNAFNPFRSFTNILNSSVGNPYLMPTYDNNFNFTFVYKGSIYNNLSYAYLQHPLQNFTTQNDSTKEMVNHITNMKQLNIIRYNFFIRQEIKSWWTVSFLAGAYYIDYSGMVNGLNYAAKAIPWYTRLTNIFMVKKNTKVEVSGFYWSPWLGGTSVFQQRGGLSMALKQSFFNNSFNVAIALNDAFFTEQFRQKADFQNQKWSLYESNDSRRLNISLSYNFGKIKAEQRETDGSDDEKKRLGH
ncbi:MAG: TonB-dependent receptor [Bacteroidetes bacterium]|nr:TonB-dependent receptor [Bacteroidota bacterium]